MFAKKEELMQKQIEEAAFERVKDALVQNMRMQEGLSEDELIEEFEERADREALNIINTADMSESERKVLGDIIAGRHVIEAEKRRKAREAVKKVKEYAKEQELNMSESEVLEENTENESGSGEDKNRYPRNPT